MCITSQAMQGSLLTLPGALKTQIHPMLLGFAIQICFRICATEPHGQTQTNLRPGNVSPAQKQNTGCFGVFMCTVSNDNLNMMPKAPVLGPFSPPKPSNMLMKPCFN